jgi:PKD repeat protein
MSGIYPVTLTTSNSNGSNTLTKTDYITVAPIADFKANKTVISSGESINFMDISTVISQPTSYLWSFIGGNPSTSVLANPNNIYYSQPGTYNVCLTITTAAGNQIICKNNYITVYANCTYQLKDSVPQYYINQANAANFQIKQEDFDSLVPYYAGHSTKWNIFNKINSPGDTNFFYGATSFFTQTGQANNWLEFGPITIPTNGAILKWDHLYYLNTKRDAYEVLLSTSGLTKDYYTAPPIFSRADNDPQTNNDTLWKTQEVTIDGTIYGGQQIYVAFHHFANNKYYLFLDNIKVISCSGLPINANFSADSTTINTGNSVDFFDGSTGNPTSWKWTFYGGNPSTSTLQNPTGITYNTYGYHNVKLVVNNGFETDSIIKTNFIFSNNTGIFADEKQQELFVYPNPAYDYINIVLNNNNELGMNIKILDLLGNTLLINNIKKQENQIKIPLQTLKKGVYFIELKTKEKTLFKKFIKSE